MTALNLASDCDVNYKMARNKRLLVEMTLLKMTYINRAIELSQQTPIAEKKKIIESESPREAVQTIVKSPKLTPSASVQPSVAVEVSSKADVQDAAPEQTKPPVVPTPLSNDEIPKASEVAEPVTPDFPTAVAEPPISSYESSPIPSDISSPAVEKQSPPTEVPRSPLPKKSRLRRSSKHS